MRPLLAAALLALLPLSLGPKLLLRDVPPDIGYLRAMRAATLRQFLESQGAADFVDVAPARYGAVDHGWRFRLAACSALALPTARPSEWRVWFEQATGPEERLRYIYRGRVADAAPTQTLLTREFVARIVDWSNPVPRREFVVAWIGDPACLDPARLPWLDYWAAADRAPAP